MEIHESDAKKITEIKNILKKTGAEEIKVKNSTSELLEEFDEKRKKEEKKIKSKSKKNSLVEKFFKIIGKKSKK